MSQRIPIGKIAILLCALTEEESDYFRESLEEVKYCQGRVGSMNMQKVISAVETAAKRNGLIHDSLYRETHALYHAIVEAIRGVTRGQPSIGEMSRTVGLRFSVVRGKPYINEGEGEWVSVAFYGTIGAPVKGLEHETIGLGVNHI
ncbi:hut operon transcriptional regulator HutP [Bacillus sp. V5-8f]|uniref:hut operon transcriptional regulator HutP n=1 Tax=Bacillus sp. V5-8f TaxID=2053044 RepID=UPI000C76463F|nr:hut operon transcriptional regulator HutP [Bacillus sp. V5-8f]PLT35465.1 anti-terminator HutP [Bacillus sp. V5-8f]